MCGDAIPYALLVHVLRPADLGSPHPSVGDLDKAEPLVEAR